MVWIVQFPLPLRLLLRERVRARLGLRMRVRAGLRVRVGLVVGAMVSWSARYHPNLALNPLPSTNTVSNGSGSRNSGVDTIQKTSA
jgi:hypothetical protein